MEGGAYFQLCLAGRWGWCCEDSSAESEEGSGKCIYVRRTWWIGVLLLGMRDVSRGVRGDFGDIQYIKAWHFRHDKGPYLSDRSLFTTELHCSVPSAVQKRHNFRWGVT